MNAIQFFTESIRNLKTVGTITRSSRFLCQKIINQIDFEKSKFLVELGAGDGVITHHILKHMRSDAKLLAFEVNESFVQKLQGIKDDRLIVVKDSAEKLEDYLKINEFETVDHIVSALPFAIIPDDVTSTIVSACEKNLKENGLYLQVHYSLVERNTYKNAFGNVKVNFVPLNIPPAFVLQSTKK